jgi:hypothetical protein
MTHPNHTLPHTFTPALKAIGKLFEDEFAKNNSWGSTEAIMAHGEIGQSPISQKASAFYRHYFPLRKAMVVILADGYRRYFKLSLAHMSQDDGDADDWAQRQLWPSVCVVLNWLRDWYILACNGENQSVRRISTIPFVPGQTVSIPIPLSVPPFLPPAAWRAPTWLFGVSIALFGIGLLKEHHAPPKDTDERLGEAHTRLLLKGGRRVFFWELGAAIERVRNEELASAGAIRVEASNKQERGPNKRKGWRQRLKLYSAIRKVLSANPSLQGMGFCAELDKRHALPLLDWRESGEWREGLTWKEAWRDPDLRRKIRRVRQEAQKTN